MRDMRTMSIPLPSPPTTPRSCLAAGISPRACGAPISAMSVQPVAACSTAFWLAQILQNIEGHSGWAQSVAFSNDGSKIVSGSADKNLCVWNVETGQVMQTLEGHTNSVRAVSYSKDSTLIASGGLDSIVRLWSVETNQVCRCHRCCCHSCSHCFGVSTIPIVAGGADLQGAHLRYQLHRLLRRRHQARDRQRRQDCAYLDR